jgi:hypothetical protein
MMRNPSASLAAAGAGRAPLTVTADDALDATGCFRMHRHFSRRNDDARRATLSAASSLHQIQAVHEVPGHRSRAAPRQVDGAARPHAAPQTARVHAKCRMMHRMQLRSLASGSCECGAARAVTALERSAASTSPRDGRLRARAPESLATARQPGAPGALPAGRAWNTSPWRPDGTARWRSRSAASVLPAPPTWRCGRSRVR